MRAKSRRPAPLARDLRPATLPTARWLLDAEISWGMPHPIMALPGLAVLAVGAALAAIARLWLFRRR